MRENALNREYTVWNSERFAAYTADMEQIAYARPSVLQEGNGRGNRIIEVNNGSGLCFTLTPDRGLDIVEAAYCGFPVAFRTACGHVSPDKLPMQGIHWLRAWAGGLLTTCGLRHVGQPESAGAEEFGLHDRISVQSAEDVGIERGWRDGRYVLRVSGTLRQARAFGENLRLRRTISTALGENTISVEDEVCNLGPKPEVIQILYHCNLGFPAVCAGTRLEAIEHPVQPRDPIAAAGLSAWNILPEPQPDFAEQCFLHTLAPIDGNWAEIAAVNEQAGLRITVGYDTTTLPRLMQWKMSGEGLYALGLEPTNTTVSGRAADTASGVAQVLKPGGTLPFRIRLSFSAL